MMTPSEIIHANPIGQGLDSFRDAHAKDPTDEGNNGTAVHLLLSVQCLPASPLLPSKRGKGSLLSDLSRLTLAVVLNCYDHERIKPLLDVVFSKQPDEDIWEAVYDLIPPLRTLSSTSCFANSTEHRKGIDAPNKIQSSYESASLLCCPFLRLPSEIRCLIYRILLRSDGHLRMIPPPQDEQHVPCPNNLHPSILGTCRLVYEEAHYVLYGENYFHAHRINKDNRNAALIRRAIYRIGSHEREEGEDEARKLADFMGFQRELRFIKLRIGFDLIEDPSIYDLVRQAIQDHRHLMHIKICSPSAFNGIGWRHAWRLRQSVKERALLLEWLGEN